MKKILLLGEGNFSFTRSLFTILSELKIEAQILATSYDTEAELIQKYPEFLFIKSEIAKLSIKSQVNVQFLHSVNATNLNNNTHLKDLLFDEIIFNFPHLAMENLFIHRSFLSHFLFSSKCLLNENEGILSVALSETQCKNWMLKEIASNNNFKIIDEIPIILSYWPYYELKRHHTGKSFQNRIENIYHYSFSLKKINDNSEEISNSLLRYLYDISTSNKNSNDSININSNNSTQKINSNLNLDSSLNINSNSISNNKNNFKNENTVQNINSGKKRKVHQMVEGLYSIKQNENNITSYICSICNKLFSNEQGIRGHVYNFHLLNNKNKNLDDKLSNHEISNKTEEKYECEICIRLFSSKDAFNQHMISKHKGDYKNISSTWKNNDNDEELISKELFKCEICDMKFDNLNKLQLHKENGLLPQNINLAYKCEFCNKDFRDDRALKQHINFCKLKF